MNLTAKTLLALSAIFLSACAESPYDDVHSQPREPQPWENVDISGFSASQLLDRLETLAEETQLAAANGAYVEFHHLEVAMTPALEALESMVEGDQSALATLAQLKDLAIKLHVAGHEANVQMGEKLAPVIQSNLATLRGQLVQ